MPPAGLVYETEVSSGPVPVSGNENKILLFNKATWIMRGRRAGH